MLWTVLGTFAVQLLLLAIAAIAVGIWVDRGLDRSFSLSVSFDRRGYTGWGFFSLGKDTFLWIKALTLGYHSPCLEDQYNEIGDHIQNAWDTGYNRGKRDGLEDGFEEAKYNFETFGNVNPHQRRVELQYGRHDMMSLEEEATATFARASIPPDAWDDMVAAPSPDPDDDDGHESLWD